MSKSSVCEMAYRNISSSSVRLISQGLLRFASDGSIRTLSGGLERSEELGTRGHLCRLVVHHPRDSSGGVDAVGHVAFGDEDVSERDRDYLRLG